MKKLLSTFILALTVIGLHGQTYVLEYGDTLFQNRVSFDNWDTSILWEFKPNLEKGEYWIINQTECGPDTLAFAKFLNIGIKHGTWIEWESGLCTGTFKEGTEIVDNWSFSANKEKYSETVYDSGFIVKSILYHLGSNQPHWEHRYPKRTIRKNQWNEERIWREDGTLQWSTKVNEDGSAKHSDYYPSGQVQSTGHFGTEGSYLGVWKYYHENGQLMSQGYFESFGDKETRFFNGPRVPKGFWQFWDNEGNLIAEVKFRNGKLKKIKRYQETDIPVKAINDLINDN